MLKEKAGALAGRIWEALNGTEGLTQKQIKKAAKLKIIIAGAYAIGTHLASRRGSLCKIGVNKKKKLIKKCVGTSFFVCSQRIFLYICAKFKRRR